MLRLVLFASLLVLGTVSFSIPGVAIKNYNQKERIEVYANELDSVKTQLNFKYYFLKFCESENQDLKSTNENLGSKLLGESTQHTPYIVQVGVNQTAQELCAPKFGAEDVKNFAWMIEREYYANLVVDNLPAIYKSASGSSHVGFPIGGKNPTKNKKQNEYYINNHLIFKIEYYQVTGTDQIRIVGFSIEPKSLNSYPDGEHGYFSPPPEENETKDESQLEEPKKRILEEPQPEEPQAKTPEEPQAKTPEEVQAKTPEEPQPEEPKAKTPEEPQPEEPKKKAPEDPKKKAPEDPKKKAPEDPKKKASEDAKTGTPEKPETKPAPIPKPTGPQILKEGKVHFSYEVHWIAAPTKAFGSRWDTYKLLGNETIHWWSIGNSFIINLILTTVIGYIMKRTVGNDIRQYNELRTSEDIQEDRGWKQLSRDVFRPPSKALLLSSLIGTGVQVGTMFFLTLVFCCLGFIEHSYRGSLLTTILLFYTFMGMFAGYYSARVYKMFNGLHWIKCTMVTATLYPLINFIIFCAINILLVFEESSSALDPGTTLALIALWFGISIPLVFLGSLIGYKKQAIQNPSKYNPIPKFIKPQPMYLNANVLCLLGGLLPFGSVFIELVFIMMSIWRHSFYYLFAFLFAVLLILIITSAEISIVITYLQLCNGNHRVWWKAFFNTGSIGLYIFCYSIFYYYTELEMIRFSSIMLYFGYMLAVSFTFFVFCGTVGFLASYWFIRTIYASIRID